MRISNAAHVLMNNKCRQLCFKAKYEPRNHKLVIDSVSDSACNTGGKQQTSEIADK